MLGKLFSSFKKKHQTKKQVHFQHSNQDFKNRVKSLDTKVASGYNPNSKDYFLKQTKHIHEEHDDDVDLYARPKIGHKDVSNPEKMLNDMIGLYGVKNQLNRCIDNELFLKRSHHYHQHAQNESLNMIFEGNPGTGKTQVARLFAKILYKRHLCKTSHFEEVSAGDFLSGLVGQDSKNVRHIISESLGGVLFIDEAYELAPANNGDALDESKKDILAELIRQIENNRGNLVVIMAGYTDQMEQLLDVNPGLRSRFNHKIHFPDYDLVELFQIFKLHATLEKLTIPTVDYPLVFTELKHFIPFAKKNKDTGNGRTIRNLVERIKDARNVRHGKKIRHMNLKQLDMANADDIKNAFKNEYLNDLVQKSKGSNYLHVIIATNFKNTHQKRYAFDKIISTSNSLGILKATSWLLNKSSKFIKDCHIYTYQIHSSDFNVLQNQKKNVKQMVDVDSCNKLIQIIKHYNQKHPKQIKASDNSVLQISRDDDIDKNIKNHQNQNTVKKNKRKTKLPSSTYTRIN